MRHIPKLTVVAVLLFLAALCGCCTGASTDIQVRSAAFTSETGRRWSASSAQMEELERAYAQARSVDSGWGTTPPATIDAILATGEAVRIMGGGQHFQTIVRD